MKISSANFKNILLNFCYFMCIYVITIIILLLILNPIINFYEHELSFPLFGKLSFPLYIGVLALITTLLGSIVLFLKLKFKLNFNKKFILGITSLGILIPLNAHISIYYFIPEVHTTAYWAMNDFLLLLIVIGILILIITFEVSKTM
jgi:hypothetical protein